MVRSLVEDIVISVYWPPSFGVKIAENFTPGEFACKGDKQSPVYIANDLVFGCQTIRTKSGRVVNVNSGFRTYQHNRKIDGSTYSRHVAGIAADIVVVGLSSADMSKIAYDSGFRRIGRGKNFIHVDVEARLGSNDGNQAYWVKVKGKEITMSYMDMIDYDVKLLV